MLAHITCIEGSYDGYGTRYLYLIYLLAHNSCTEGSYDGQVFRYIGTDSYSQVNEDSELKEELADPQGISVKRTKIPYFKEIKPKGLGKGIGESYLPVVGNGTYMQV